MMTKCDLLPEAKQLRERGLSYQAIGKKLGRSHTTIRQWLNQDAAQYYLDYTKNWNKRHRKQLSQYAKVYQRSRKQTDLQFRLKANLRTRLSMALRNHQKAGSAVSDLGCSILELKEHLESQFQSGMSWENYGRWHIDHIRPLASFNLTDREQFLEANHYTNLQPLWAEDNLRKGDTWQ